MYVQKNHQTKENKKENENFWKLRGQLDQAVRDLPAFLEELKKVRMGDEMIEKLVRDFKDEMRPFTTIIPNLKPN